MRLAGWTSGEAGRITAAPKGTFPDGVGVAVTHEDAQIHFYGWQDEEISRIGVPRDTMTEGTIEWAAASDGVVSAFMRQGMLYPTRREHMLIFGDGGWQEVSIPDYDDTYVGVLGCQHPRLR